jgi:hypothetical protein
MSAAQTLEQRVAALEYEMQELKGGYQSLSARKPNPNWFNEVAGSRKDFPVFAEVRRSMREAREAELAEFDKSSEPS